MAVRNIAGWITNTNTGKNEIRNLVPGTDTINPDLLPDIQADITIASNDKLLLYNSSTGVLQAVLNMTYDPDTGLLELRGKNNVLVSSVTIEGGGDEYTFQATAETISYQLPASVEVTTVGTTVTLNFKIPNGYPGLPGSAGEDATERRYVHLTGEVDLNEYLKGPAYYYIEDTATLLNGPEITLPAFFTVENDEGETSTVQTLITADGIFTRIGVVEGTGQWLEGHYDIYVSATVAEGTFSELGYIRADYVPNTLSVLWRSFTVFALGSSIEGTQGTTDPDLGPNISGEFTLRLNFPFPDNPQVQIGDTVVATFNGTTWEFITGVVQRDYYRVDITSGSAILDAEDRWILTFQYTGYYQNAVLEVVSFSDWAGGASAGGELSFIELTDTPNEYSLPVIKSSPYVMPAQTYTADGIQWLDLRGGVLDVYSTIRITGTAATKVLDVYMNQQAEKNVRCGFVIHGTNNVDGNDVPIIFTPFVAPTSQAAQAKICYFCIKNESSTPVSLDVSAQGRKGPTWVSSIPAETAYVFEIFWNGSALITGGDIATSAIFTVNCLSASDGPTRASETFFLTSGTSFTPLRSGIAKVTCVGGGGAGGFIAAQTNLCSIAAPGGSSGGVVEEWVRLTGGTTYTYSIGNGGAGIVGGVAAGSTVFNGPTTITATGGVSGTGYNATAPINSIIVQPRLGVTPYGASPGTNGDIYIINFTTSLDFQSHRVTSGYGGSTRFGAGAIGRIPALGAALTGSPGTGYGAGGSGAAVSFMNDAPVTVGGNGTTGCIEIVMLYD